MPAAGPLPRLLLPAVLCLCFASVASAINRTWQGDNTNTWNWDSTASHWDPSGVPGSSDVAIFNASDEVDLVVNPFIAGLTMSGGIQLDLNGRDLDVTGLAAISGADTDLFVPTNSLLTANDVAIGSGGGISLRGGYITVDGATGTGVFDVHDGAHLFGNGTIALTDSVTAGTIVFDHDGTLTAASSAALDLTSSAAATLFIIATDPDGRIDLDGNDNSSTININRNDSLQIFGQIHSAYSGTLNIGSGARFNADINHDWALDGTLNTVVGSAVGSFSTAATISGGDFTQSGGAINIDGGESLQIESLTFTLSNGDINNGGTLTIANVTPMVLTGTGEINNSGTLTFSGFTATNGTINNSGHIVFGGNANISGIAFNMTGPTASLTVGTGAQVFITSNDLELDGVGALTNIVNINSGGLLDLSLVTGADNTFTGTINLSNGILEVTTSDNDWSLGGTVNVNFGPSQINGEEVTFTDRVNIGPGSVLFVNAPAVYQGGAVVEGTGTLVQNNSTTVLNGGSAIRADTYDWDYATTTIERDAGLFIDVNHIENASDEYNNTVNVYEGGVLDVSVADGEWILGIGGRINLTQRNFVFNNDAFLSGDSKLSVNGGSIHVDDSVTISVSTLAIHVSSAILFDDDGTLDINGELELLGGDILNANGASYNSRVNLNGGLTAVSGDSTVSPRIFNWDESPTTVSPGATLRIYADAIEADDPQRHDDQIHVDRGTLVVDLGDHTSWTTDFELVLSNDGTMLYSTIVEGDSIEVGDDIGVLDANLLVTGLGPSQINTPLVTFNSDADVLINPGALLIINGFAYFSPVNGANNGAFTGGGYWAFKGPVAFAEATTIDMPTGYVDLSGAGARTIDAPVTMNLQAMANFIGYMQISTDLTGLTVNLTDPSAEWTINSGSTIDCFGDSTNDIFLAGSDINLNGTINIYGDGQISARTNIGPTGVINILSADGLLSLHSGSSEDPTTISGGVINGPGTLKDSEITGYGQVHADVESGNIFADDGVLRIFGEVNGADIGVIDEDGTLSFEIGSSATNVHLGLLGGQVVGSSITVDASTVGIVGTSTIAVGQLINNGVIAVALDNGTAILDRVGAAGYDWDGDQNNSTIAIAGGEVILVANENVGFGGTIVVAGAVIEFEGLGFDVYNSDGDQEIVLGTATYRSNVQHRFGGYLATSNNADGASELDVPDARFLNGSLTYLESDLRLRQDTFIEAGATFESAGGRLRVLNGATLTIDPAANTDTLDITLQGGTVVIGPGPVALAAYTQSDTSTLEIALGGSGPPDIGQLIVSGEASLAGTLNVVLDDFVPSGGESFEFLVAAGGITGAFDTINLPTLPFGLSWGLNDGVPNMLQLVVVDQLPGDFNLDGAIDVADFVMWRKNDGSSNGYLTWHQSFGEPFGGGAAAQHSATVPQTQIPEPAGVALLVWALVCLVFSRRLGGLF
jgi:hypothetical protein